PPPTPTPYTLSLHDALPISLARRECQPLHRTRLQEPQLIPGIVYLIRHGQTNSNVARLYAGRSAESLNEVGRREVEALLPRLGGDRKSTRLNSSHVAISYAV